MKKEMDISEKFINKNFFEDTQLLDQLEYLMNKVNNRENIGLDLIELLRHENAIGFIHKEAESQLILELNGRHAKSREIIVISLSIVALQKYDGNFYDYVQEEFSSLYEQFSEQKIEGTIRTILKCYREAEGTRQFDKRIINVVLKNALVPIHFLPAFFEFIFDIYKINFDCDLPDERYEDFSFVYEGLKQIMLSSGDEFKVNVTKKTYKLIETTKQLIAEGTARDSIIELSNRIVSIIDSWYWGKENAIDNPYLEQGYNEWVSENSIKSKEKGKKRKSSPFRSRWEPNYQSDGQNIYIVPPLHRIKDQYNYTDVSVCVKNDGDTIFQEDKPYIKEIFGGYQISVDKIKLENPLGKIQYLLLAGQDVIYSSQDKLYRDFLVFNSEGEEIQNNTDYQGTAVICAEPNLLQPDFKSEYYWLTEKKIRDENLISVGDQAFCFSSFKKPDVFGNIIEQQYLKNRENGELLKVFSHVEFLVFETDNMEGRFEININHLPHKLEEFDFQKSKQQNAERLILNLDFLTPGIYNIVVYKRSQGVKEKLAAFKFGYDPKFNRELKRLNDTKYLIYVSTAMHKGTIKTELDLNHFSEDWLPVVTEEAKYSYLLPLPFSLYRIKGNAWQPIWKDLWIGDIKQDSILEIFGTDFDGMRVYNDAGICLHGLHDEIPIKNKKWYGEIHIGFLLSDKESCQFTRLIFLKEGQKKKECFCYHQCVLNQEATEISYNLHENILSVTPQYKGCGNVGIEISKQNDGDVIYKGDHLPSGEIIEVNDLHSFVNYQILFYEKPEGLSLSKRRELLRKTLVVCSDQDLCDRYFPIKEVQYDQMVHKQFLRKTHSFHTVYVYFSEKTNKDKFRGRIIEKHNGKFYDLSKINPVEIELCSSIADSEMEVSITNQGDGLFLDFEHHRIKNTLDDKSGTDIFSYLMDIHGVKKLWQN